jgi:cell volume regulation protein A
VPPIEQLLLASGILLLLSILASKASGRLGLPALILFLLVGMIAGSEGLGGIAFDNPFLAQSLGVIALAFILFSGGLDTDWQAVRPNLGIGIALSTVAVLLTALTMGVAASILLRISLLQGLLLGAIVSSTDAAAVFSVMRSRGTGLKDQIKRILELESGSNDPMAIFLTIGLITLIMNPTASVLGLILMFTQQMLFGAAVGIALGYLMTVVINRLNLAYDGLYPVFTLAIVLVIYGVAALIGGNGFLAVYLAGLIMGNHEFVHKRSIKRFHDGIGWLMQITMFITLGLLVFPSQLFAIAGAGLLLALILIFVARPLGVMLTLWFTRLRLSEKAIISWVGLRGAVPIILATYPLVMGVPDAALIFNVVFFIVVTSVLLQGPLIPVVARWLKADEVQITAPRYPIEFEQTANLNGDLVELVVAQGSSAVNKKILELGLPDDVLIVLLSRDQRFLVPRGVTTLQAEDRLLVLADAAGLLEARQLIEG